MSDNKVVDLFLARERTLDFMSYTDIHGNPMTIYEGDKIPEATWERMPEEEQSRIIFEED